MTLTTAKLAHGETDAIALTATLAKTRSGRAGFHQISVPELLKVGPFRGGHGRLAVLFSHGPMARSTLKPLPTAPE